MSRPALRRDELDPFTDLLFNALLGFTVLFIVALMALQPPAKQGDVPGKAEYLITASWPDGAPDDVDLWVQGPAGDLVWFRQPQSGLLGLERDDRGVEGDIQQVDGRSIVNPLNQEVVALRGIVPGEYIVNLQYYRGDPDRPKAGGPVEVQVSVSRVNPQLRVVFHESVSLARPGDEATAVRFTLTPEGDAVGVNRLHKRLAEPIRFDD